LQREYRREKKAALRDIDSRVAAFRVDFLGGGDGGIAALAVGAMSARRGSNEIF
jgi:hypothetical protein